MNLDQREKSETQKKRISTKISSLFQKIKLPEYKIRFKAGNKNVKIKERDQWHVVNTFRRKIKGIIKYIGSRDIFSGKSTRSWMSFYAINL